MKLFLRHLRRSISRRPLQPFVILLTLALSVTVFCVALGAKEAISEEARLLRLEQFGSADVEIGLSSSSDSRFMFTDDVRRIVGQDVAVAGYYELPVVTDSGVTFAVAADFYELGEIYSLRFSEYGQIDSSRLSVSAIVSRRFAEANSLSLGEAFSASVFNTDEVYTVEAISETPVFASFDVLIDIRGAMRLLSADSSLAAALGDSFRPCSKIFVDTKDVITTADCIDALLSSEEFADKSIVDTGKRATMEDSNDTFHLLFDFVMIFAAVLSSAVTFAALYILSTERTEENRSFLLAGARERYISGMQYLEVLGYWMVSGVIGFLLSVPLMKLLARSSGIVYASCAVSLDVFAVSLLFTVVIAMLTVTLFVAVKDKKHKARSVRITRAVGFVSTALTVLLTVLTYALPKRFSLAFGVAALIVWLFTAAFAAPRVFVYFVAVLAKKSEKRVTGGSLHTKPSIYYALKNLLRLKLLHNVARLAALLVAVVLSAVSIILSANGNVAVYERLFDSDYALLGATERSAELAADCESAESSYSAFLGSATYSNGESCVALGASDAVAFSDVLGVKELPVGNGAIIGSGMAKALDLDVGDTFIAEVQGIDAELSVFDISYSGISMLIVDVEALGIEPNLVLVKAKDSEALATELSTALADELATVVTVDKLMARRLSLVNVYRNVGNVFLLILSVFAIIGFADNVAESYRSRRGELELYGYCGMRSRGVSGMKATEIAVTALFGLAYGFVIFLGVAVIVSEAMTAIAYEMLINLRNGIFGI